MKVRAIALAVPVALGIACTHTQGQGSTGVASAPAPGGAAASGVVEGRIADVAGGEIAIATPDLVRTLHVRPQTQVVVDGRSAGYQDLAPGQQVRARYDEVNGQVVAVEIHARGTPETVGGARPPGTGAAEGGTGSAPPPAQPPNTGAGQGAAGPPASW